MVTLNPTTMEIPSTDTNEQFSIRAYTFDKCMRNQEKFWLFSGPVDLEALPPGCGFVPKTSHDAAAAAASPKDNSYNSDDNMEILEVASALVDFSQQTQREHSEVQMAAACAPECGSGAKSRPEEPVPQKKICRDTREKKALAGKSRSEEPVPQKKICRDAREKRALAGKSTSAGPNVENEASKSQVNKKKANKSRVNKKRAKKFRFVVDVVDAAPLRVSEPMVTCPDIRETSFDLNRVAVADPVETDFVAHQVRTVAGTEGDNEFDQVKTRSGSKGDPRLQLRSSTTGDNVIEIVDIESDNVVVGIDLNRSPTGSSSTGNTVTEIVETESDNVVVGIDLNRSPTHQVVRKKKRERLAANVDDQERDSFWVNQQGKSQVPNGNVPSISVMKRLETGGSSSSNKSEKPRDSAEILPSNLHVLNPTPLHRNSSRAYEKTSTQYSIPINPNLFHFGKENSRYLEIFPNGIARPLPNQLAEYPLRRRLGEMQLNPQSIYQDSLFPGKITYTDMLKLADAGLCAARKPSIPPSMASLNEPHRPRNAPPSKSIKRNREPHRPMNPPPSKSIKRNRDQHTNIPPGADVIDVDKPVQDSVNGFCNVNRIRAEIDEEWTDLPNQKGKEKKQVKG